jgi:hypothetical protein
MVDCTWLAWHGIFWDFVWDIERSPRSLRSVSTRHNWEGSRIEHLVSLWLPLLGEYPSFDKHGWNSQLVFLSFPSWELNFTAPGSNGLPSFKDIYEQTLHVDSYHLLSWLRPQQDPSSFSSLGLLLPSDVLPCLWATQVYSETSGTQGSSSFEPVCFGNHPESFFMQAVLFELAALIIGECKISGT